MLLDLAKGKGFKELLNVMGSLESEDKLMDNNRGGICG